MSARRRRKVPDALGGRLFGGPRRTTRQFVTIVSAVVALVGVLTAAAWQRFEMVETIEENRSLDVARRRLVDRVVRSEADLGRRASPRVIIERAERELGLRLPVLTDVVFVPDRMEPAREDAGL